MEIEFIELAVKNMVCPRCIKVVKEGFEQMGYQVLAINLGSVKVKGTIDFVAINKMLIANGFELLASKEQKLIEEIKINIINLVQLVDLRIHQNVSVWLAQQLNTDYHYLSVLFSAAEGITIERFFILHRIEKVKELLVYNEMNLKEIAFLIGFSSVSHLSAQFKKITGFTTTHFKEIGQQKRKSLDQI